MAKRLSNKSSKRYYGPYSMAEKVENVAYRLALPYESLIHPVFHVALLKPYRGASARKVDELPLDLLHGQAEELPLG